MQTLKTLPTSDTVSYHLLELIAISGEFPTDQLKRIAGGNAYKEVVVTRLKKQRLVRTVYRDGLRGLRLTPTAKKHLLANNDVRFFSSLSGDSETNHPNTDPARRLRLHRIAAATVTMQNAGVQIFRDEKPDVFAPVMEESELRTVLSPAFYNSREIKEIGTVFVKIKGARSVGVLLTASTVFVVYNLGDSLMKWEYKAEMRTKALMKTVFCRERLTGYSSEDIQGLLLADRMELCADILTNTADKQYFLLDGNYDRFLFLTNDHRGERILAMLCEPYLEERLIFLLKSDLLDEDPGLTIENDGFTQDGKPVLFAYTCDLPRIKRFDTALNLREREGVIICFDFQKPALSAACGKQITFQTIDFEKWERSFFET